MRFKTFGSLFLMIIDCFAVSSSQLHPTFFNFDQEVSEVFFGSNFSNFKSNSGQNDVKCASELSRLQQSLRRYEKWAIEVLDSWGKFPSGIFSGNIFDMGAFSQCFHIDRNGETYETQYCLGQLNIKLNGITGSKMFQSDDFEDVAAIQPRVAPGVPTTRSGINFGVCIPKVCSPELIETVINSKINGKFQKISVKIPQETCQSDENYAELKTIDIVVIVLLATILSLMVISTVYDVIWTMSNREKSQAFIVFSVYTNGSKLFSCKATGSNDVMHCLNGIRVISTAWVVLGHSHLSFLVSPLRNFLYYLTFISKYYNMMIMSAFKSVDTFFLLSGLLVSLNMLKHLEKTNGRINIFKLYFHRFLRLTPLLGVSILLLMSLVKFLGNGPIWRNSIELEIDTCERSWWATLFYLNNYVRADDMCLSYSWYLAVDSQLFVISPAVVYLLYRFKRKILPIYVIAVGLCAGCTIGLYLKYGFGGRTDGSAEKQQLWTYFPTHVRYSVWLIGVMLGYVFFEARKIAKVHISKTLNQVGWITSLTVMTIVIFGNYPLEQRDSTNTPLERALYDALGRIGWALSLSYIIFACVYGYGGPVNWFLSLPLWQPLSRLSYSIYLMHYLVLLVMTKSMKQAPNMDKMTAFHTFLSHYSLVVIVSVAATLAFESPIVAMEKLIFGTRKKENTKPQEITTADEESTKF